MTKTTYEGYLNDLEKFINKHSKKADWRVITSPYKNGQYHKQYVFEDGAILTDVNYMEGETYPVFVEELGFTANIPVIKHEYWSTDESGSKYWYEHL